MDSTPSPLSTLDRRALRRAFLLALIPGVILAGRLANSAEVTVLQEDGQPWTIEITPAPRGQLLALQQPAPAQEPSAEELFENQPEPAPEEPAPLPQDAEPAQEQPAQSFEQTPPPQTRPAPQVQPAPVPRAGDTGIEIVPNGKFAMNGMTYRQIYESIPYSRAEYLANPSYRHEATMELLTGTPRQTGINRTYEPQLNTPIEPQPQFLYNYYGRGYGYGPSPGYGYGLGYYYHPQYAPAFRYFLPIDYGL